MKIPKDSEVKFCIYVFLDKKERGSKGAGYEISKEIGNLHIVEEERNTYDRQILVSVLLAPAWSPPIYHTQFKLG